MKNYYDFNMKQKLEALSSPGNPVTSKCVKELEKDWNTYNYTAQHQRS